MLMLLLSWLAVGVGMVWLTCQRRRGSAGLPLAYFLGTSLIHVPGAIVYLDADESNVTRVGFELTIVGLVAFLVGVLIARHAYGRRLGQQASAGHTKVFAPQGVAGLNRLALLYLFVGSIVFFGLLPAVETIPSVTALVSPLGSLITVGICLRFWMARESRSRFKFWSAMAFLPLLPLVTVVQSGFLGFGTMWVLAIMSFLFAQSNRRLGFFLLTPVVFFVGLSVFVNYMAAREELRQLVWYQQAGIGDRLNRIVRVVQDFEWLDLSNWRHRDAIDGRLNQNSLIGVAVARLESGAVQYASGDTLVNVTLALIPRVLWPDKPAVGGGGTVVRDFTGLEFGDSTSVGAGPVFEFYVNFGSVGVIVGLLLYGWLLGWMDLRLITSLWQGDQRDILFWFLVSLALLTPGGNLVETVVTGVASAITAHGIGYLLRRHLHAHDMNTLARVTPGRP